MGQTAQNLHCTYREDTVAEYLEFGIPWHTQEKIHTPPSLQAHTKPAATGIWVAFQTKALSFCR